MRRGIEIAAEVADSPVSVITAQVGGVAVRMAVLYLLLGSGARSACERQVVLRGGTVVDVMGTRRADVLVRGEVVADVSQDLGSPPAGAVVLDAGGCVVAPGLVDLHTHLREPGAEESETVETGARAAALGGYTAVIAMPNTEPAADSAAVVRHVLDLAKGACCDVYPAGTVTLGRQGKALSPMAEIAALGVRIFTDDGAGVDSAALMRLALEYASGLEVVVADHCEEASLVGHGCTNEGDLSSRLGLPGRPAVAEEVMVERDLAFARPDRRPSSPPAPVVRPIRGRRPAGQGGRRGRHGRGDAAPPRPHRGRFGQLRHPGEGQPAAAHIGGREGASSGMPTAP